MRTVDIVLIIMLAIVLLYWLAFLVWVITSGKWKKKKYTMPSPYLGVMYRVIVYADTNWPESEKDEVFRAMYSAVRDMMMEVEG